MASVRLLRPVPALVAVHGPVAAHDGRHLAPVPAAAAPEQLGEVLARGLRRRVATVQEHMHADVRDARAAPPARTRASRCSSTACTPPGPMSPIRCSVLPRSRTASRTRRKTGFSRELAGLDGGGDALQRLHDDAAGAQVHVPHLGVAHLPLREAHGGAVRRQPRAGVAALSQRCFQVGVRGHGDGVVGARLAQSPAVQDDQAERAAASCQACCRSVGGRLD